ncbi:MAG TPA: hypothetical protein VJ785_00125 [Anaerolineales bacterium]|nr:hypothetical protein [Anaerolineales bacterium]
MIDPTQLPILLKAIDFVFEEGRKILEERRERRRMQDQLSMREEKEVSQEITLQPEKAAEVKQDLITTKVDELLWQHHEQEVQHLVRLWETYSRNYYLAREQYAKWGDALVPPIIVNNLRDAENSMVETLKRLEEVLSKVYKKDLPPIQ